MIGSVLERKGQRRHRRRRRERAAAQLAFPEAAFVAFREQRRRRLFKRGFETDGINGRRGHAASLRNRFAVRQQDAGGTLRFHVPRDWMAPRGKTGLPKSQRGGRWFEIRRGGKVGDLQPISMLGHVIVIVSLFRTMIQNVPHLHRCAVCRASGRDAVVNAKRLLHTLGLSLREQLSRQP